VTSIFPMFMKLAGKRCLVVGAGKVGEPKIGGLIDTGARIHVVAIKASSRVREWADAGKIKLELRTFSENDLDGKFLAVVATASGSLNELIYREAQRRGVLCNVVDVPEYCDFFYPAVVRRGDLQIAISTTGRVRPLRRKFDSNWSGSLASDTRRGLSSSARHDGSFWPAISIKRRSWSYCTRWRAGKRSRQRWPRSRR